MEVSLIIIGALIAVGIILYINDRRTKPSLDKEHDTENTISDPDENSECCGMHITCEKDSLLSSVSDTIVYYDDEELDRFAGREPDQYTADEIEEFRDVLLTLLPEDIAGWGRSIQLRGITLPTDVREELLMIVGEARSKA